MPRATVATNPTTIEIEYDTFGSPDDPALLLVMGFTAQLIAWDDGVLRGSSPAAAATSSASTTATAGCRRTSTASAVDPMAVMAASLAGERAAAGAVHLSDMAADAVGLLDHLGIERAHIVGASMGGMIVQTIAIEHPERCLSLIVGDELARATRAPASRRRRRWRSC